jgi:hypothetical protein
MRGHRAAQVNNFGFLFMFLVLEALGSPIRVEEDPEAMVAYSPTAATTHRCPHYLSTGYWIHPGLWKPFNSGFIASV